jgi:hypothetical protein
MNSITLVNLMYIDPTFSNAASQRIFLRIRPEDWDIF